MKLRAAFLGALFCAALAGTSVQAETVISTMNFRAAPSMIGQVIGSVPKGSVVTVLGTQDGWDYISLNGQTGWIHGGNLTTGTFVDTTQPQAQPAASYTAGAQSSVTATVLYGMNFRAAPGMDGMIMNTVPAGSTVQYIGTANGWDKIVYNGVTGWIAGGRITTQNTQQAPASYAGDANCTYENYLSMQNQNASAYGAGTVSGTMNFRAAPGMTGTVMGIVPVGSKVQYITSSNGWDQVVYQGTTGWIKSGYYNG